MIGLLGIRHLRTVPIGFVIFPVAEPVLFCFQIHCCQVESTVVGDECLEALLVDTGQIVDRESAERCSNSTQTVLVNKRQRIGGKVDGTQVVLHTLTSPITADLFLPLLSEAGQTVTVRSHNDVAVGSHHLEVPAVAPELAYRTLRTTLAEQQGRILLAFLVVGGQHHPYKFLLAVGGRHPVLLHLTECQL